MVQINGEITEPKGSYMYIDDGSDEVKVYFKTGAGIDKKILHEGDIIMVSGLVHQTKSEYQLLPRSQADIIKTGVSESFVTKIEQEEKEDAADIAEKYLTATAGGLTAIFAGLLGKSHKGKITAFIRKIFNFIKNKIR